MTSHYQQQLAQQLHAAETELGQRRQQVADLTEQRDLAQAGARERAYLLEHARDTLEPWGGHGDAWPDITPAIEALISEVRRQTARAEQAEARITAIRAECERLVAEVYGSHDEDDDATREICARITAIINGGQPCTCRPLNGCDCAPLVNAETVRGGRRLRATPEARP